MKSEIEALLKQGGILADSIPCDCGESNASWHGDPCGHREFCCEKCAEDRGIDS